MNKSWDKVNIASSSLVAALEEGDPLTWLKYVSISAIHDGNVDEVESLHAQTAQLCLSRWQNLPPVRAGTNSHNSLFCQFQRLIELREAGQIVVETSSHSSRQSIPDLKSLLSSWRHRLPNSFEPISDWNDIFLLRLQVFDSTVQKFLYCDPKTVAALHDRPFACILLGRAARKQGLNEAAALSLDSLTDGYIDAHYGFLKLREQIVNFQHSSVESALNLINSTNITYFSPHQKAELFRLKANFLNELNDKQKANQASW